LSVLVRRCGLLLQIACSVCLRVDVQPSLNRSTAQFFEACRRSSTSSLELDHASKFQLYRRRGPLRRVSDVARLGAARPGAADSASAGRRRSPQDRRRQRVLPVSESTSGFPRYFRFPAVLPVSGGRQLRREGAEHEAGRCRCQHRSGNGVDRYFRRITRAKMVGATSIDGFLFLLALQMRARVWKRRPAQSLFLTPPGAFSKR